jgi:hypothetical protein
MTDMAPLQETEVERFLQKLHGRRSITVHLSEGSFSCLDDNEHSMGFPETIASPEQQPHWDGP